MKLPLYRRLLMRPADALVPIAFLIASIIRPNVTAWVFGAAFAVRLLALSTSAGIRAAFAGQPAIRDVRGSVKCALIMQLLGFALAAGARFVLAENHITSITWMAESVDISGWVGDQTLNWLKIWFPALLLNLDGVFYEAICATGMGRQALISRICLAILLLAGIALYDLQAWSMAIASLSACILTACMAMRGLGNLKARLNVAPLRCAPRALLQDLLYPILYGAFCLFCVRIQKTASIRLPVSLSTFLSGAVLLQLCRTPFRRSRFESKWFNRALLIVGMPLLLIAAAAFILSYNGHYPSISALCGTCAASCVLALACAFTLYGNTGF